jgi:apyrase
MRSIVALFVIFFFALSHQASPTPELDYGIMIDAGSSGSRIYLYQWPHREQSTLPLVEPTEINQTVVSKKNSNALSNYDKNPGEAGASLAPLIDYIKANLVQAKWAETPIYLKATAGMRSLSQSSQDAIIADVRAYLKTTPFNFSDPEQAKVIPGTDEGVFGWITTNYALKLLTQNNPTSTFGALDMGGASTQITFDPENDPTDNKYATTLGPNNFPLYTYSYPLGQDQAGRLLLAGLLQDNVVDAGGNIKNPCYLSGYTEVYAANNAVNVTGTGNYTECVAAIRKYIVVASTDCKSTCGIGNQYQPPLYGQYYAFSGFAYTNAFFKLAETASVGDLKNATTNYCKLTFENAAAQNPGQAASFLKNYCFTGTYLSEVLSKYGFSDSSNQIHTTTAVGEIELTWALGGMIYEANLLPFDTPNSATANFVGLFFVIISLVASLL